jgi:precorrin-3B synthase
MTAPARTIPRRCGACPGLSVPMPTGDGLLVRLLPISTVALSAFANLCTAARAHGNGVVEITSRGSIQVRGLSAASTPQFAAAIAALGIAAQDGVPILCNGLAGIDAEEILDAGALAAELRRALAQRSMAAKLGAKVSVAIDGGGALNLAALPADIRLRAQALNGGVALGVAVGGDDASATHLGIVAAAHGVEAAIRLLEIIARRGRDTRARDILAAEGVGAFCEALSSCPALCRTSTPYTHSETKNVDGRDKPVHDGLGVRASAIGMHRLRDGSLACGIGLAFGHADATSLERLTDAAAAAGANGMRAAPGRALMTIGLEPETASAFAAVADQLGFIVRPDDPQRHVVACAGAPICASAHIAARAMAPFIAASAAPHLDGSFTIHISGCAKGCAHPAPAALTVIGTPAGCALVADGSARDTPFTVVATNDLPGAIAKHARRLKHEADHV